MNTILLKIFLCILFILISPFQSSAYDIPERLYYEITWAGINVGNAMLEVSGNGSNMQFMAKVNSARLISYFYKVDDMAVSNLRIEKQKGKKTLLPIPYHYRIEVNEGDTKFNKEIISNYKTKTVTYIDHVNKERTVLNFKNLAPDPLSSLYYIRKLPLKVGGSYPITIFNSKKLNTFYIHVLKNDTVKTSLGTFKTILIKLNMNLEGEGIFFAPGELFIWLTDDKKKRPVMIKKVIPQLSVERENIFKKMPDFIKGKLKGNIDIMTAKLTKYS